MFPVRKEKKRQMKGKNFLVKTSGVKRNLLLTVMMLFLCVSAFSFPVSARESVTLHDFLGYYLCGVADSGEYGNPEVFFLQSALFLHVSTVFPGQLMPLLPQIRSYPVKLCGFIPKPVFYTI